MYGAGLFTFSPSTTFRQPGAIAGGGHGGIQIAKILTPDPH
jgi:hypothetical protein